jgi:hypothetical protein
MPKKLGAALAALLLAVPVLAIVSTSSASAHPLTRQRCDYDPISGQNFNCRTVNVRHYHTPVQRNIPKPDPKPDDTTPEDTSGDDDTAPEDTSGDDDTAPEDTSGDDDTAPEDTSGDDDTTQTCQPWPSCKGAAEIARRDPGVKSNTVTPCTALQRRHSHDHGGTANCHDKDHTPAGHAHSARKDGEQDTGTARGVAADVLCQWTSKSDARITLACGAVTGSINRQWSQAEGNEQTVYDDIYAAMKLVGCTAIGIAGTPTAGVICSGISYLIPELSDAIESLAQKIIAPDNDPGSRGNLPAPQNTPSEQSENSKEGGPPPTGTTTPAPEAESETEANRPSLSDIAKAAANPDVSRDQLETMKNQWRCYNGFPQFCS